MSSSHGQLRLLVNREIANKRTGHLEGIIVLAQLSGEVRNWKDIKKPLEKVLLKSFNANDKRKTL